MNKDEKAICYRCNDTAGPCPCGVETGLGGSPWPCKCDAPWAGGAGGPSSVCSSGFGFGTTPSKPLYPYAFPNSLIIALPIKQTQPRPSPVILCPGQNSSPSSSSKSGSCSSLGDKLEWIIRAKVVGKNRAMVGSVSVDWDVFIHHAAAMIPEVWSLRS